MKLKNLKIGQRLGAGFATIIMLMMAITGIGAFQLFQSNVRIGAIVNEQYPQTVLANTIKGDLSDTVGNMRNILVTNDPRGSQTELSLIEQSSEFIAENSAQLEKMMAGSSEARGHLDYLKGKRIDFDQAKERFIALVKDGKLDEARNLMLVEVRAFADSYAGAVDRMIDYQGKQAEAAGKEAESSVHHALVVMGALAALASVVGIAIAIIVTRGITRPLNDAVRLAESVAAGDLSTRIEAQSSDEIGKLMQSLRDMNISLGRIVGEVRSGTETIAIASVEIASGTAQLSARTEQQADSLHTTSVSVSDLRETVRRNASSAQEANALSSSATSTAVKGGDVVSQVIQTMSQIKDSSRRIGDIISVIDGIAFQTNILALNAAVEAAHAGDQGRGFAVVASEVRNLAQRSAEAAKEIKRLIGDSVEKVDAGNLLVARADETMNDILAAVTKVAAIMEEITAAGEEQTRGIESVTCAISEMDEMTQQNAALVEEATAATESMKDQAATLAKAVSVFKLIDPVADAAQLNAGAAERAVPGRLRSLIPAMLMPRRRANVQPTANQLHALTNQQARAINQ